MGAHAPRCGVDGVSSLEGERRQAAGSGLRVIGASSVRSAEHLQVELLGLPAARLSVEGGRRAGLQVVRVVAANSRRASHTLV